MNDTRPELLNDELHVSTHNEPSQGTATEKSRKGRVARFSLDYFGSFSSLLCHALGPLLLAPRVMFECGVLAGVALIVAVAVLSFYTNRFLIRSAKDANVGSYVELIDATFSKLKYVFMSLFLIFAVGDLLCDQTFFIRSLATSISMLAYSAQKDLALRAHTIGLIITLAMNLTILPFLFRRNLSWIKGFSIFAISSIALTVLTLAIGFFLPQVFNADLPLPDFQIAQPVELKLLVTAFAFYLFSYTFHDVVIDVASELKDGDLQDQEALLLDVSVGLSVVYLVVSLMGYALISSLKNVGLVDNILIFYLTKSASHRALLILPNMCMIVCFFFNVVINYVPIIKFIDKIIIGEAGPEEAEKPSETNRALIKLALFSCVLLIMVYIIWFAVDIERIYLIVASLTCPAIAILLPLMIYKTRFGDALKEEWFYAIAALGGVVWIAMVARVLL